MLFELDQKMEKFSIFWNFRFTYILYTIDQQVIGNLAQFSRFIFLTRREKKYEKI